MISHKHKQLIIMIGILIVIIFAYIGGIFIPNNRLKIRLNNQKYEIFQIYKMLNNDSELKDSRELNEKSFFNKYSFLKKLNPWKHPYKIKRTNHLILIYSPGITEEFDINNMQLDEELTIIVNGNKGKIEKNAVGNKL